MRLIGWREAESVPRAVASEALSISLLIKPRSLPLAVLMTITGLRDPASSSICCQELCLTRYGGATRIYALRRSRSSPSINVFGMCSNEWSRRRRCGVALRPAVETRSGRVAAHLQLSRWSVASFLTRSPSWRCKLFLSSCNSAAKT